MISIRKINPMARAIVTMGAVAALAGGITFASLTSNTVALSPNNITTTSASLAIGASGSCPDGNTTSTTGLQDSSLTPGDSTSVNFCLDNTGGVPLVLTASIPQSLSSSTAAQNTTLTIDCDTEGTISYQLSGWGGGSLTFPNQLDSGAIDNCTATASLSSSYSGSGNEIIPEFDINFVGNQPSS